ncbi:MAG: ECF transporter S component [Bacilli bacterium]|nr:ECF transporter S component [Bacilli bacterium]
MKNKHIINIVRTALFVALIYIVTLFINIPYGVGNINVGDSLILIGALFLSPIHLGIAGGIGPFLADITLGYGSYAPFTLIIKFLEGIIVSLLYRYVFKNKNSMICFLLASLVASIVIPLGYFLTNVFLYDLATGFASLVGDSIQMIASVIIANVLAYSIRKVLNKYDGKN